MIEKCKFSVSSFLIPSWHSKYATETSLTDQTLWYVVFSIKNGGAHKTIQYAKKLGRKIENLANEN